MEFSERRLSAADYYDTFISTLHSSLFALDLVSCVQLVVFSLLLEQLLAEKGTYYQLYTGAFELE